MRSYVIRYYVVLKLQKFRVIINIIRFNLALFLSAQMGLSKRWCSSEKKNNRYTSKKWSWNYEHLLRIDHSEETCVFFCAIEFLVRKILRVFDDFFPQEFSSFFLSLLAKYLFRRVFLWKFFLVFCIERMRIMVIIFGLNIFLQGFKPNCLLLKCTFAVLCVFGWLYECGSLLRIIFVVPGAVYTVKKCGQKWIVLIQR